MYTHKPCKTSLKVCLIHWAWECFKCTHKKLKINSTWSQLKSVTGVVCMFGTVLYHSLCMGKLPKLWLQTLSFVCAMYRKTYLCYVPQNIFVLCTAKLLHLSIAIHLSISKQLMPIWKKKDKPLLPKLI